VLAASKPPMLYLNYKKITMNFLLGLDELKEKLWNLASDKNVAIYEIETFLRLFFKHKPLPLGPSTYKNYCRCSLNNKGEIFTTVERCSYNPYKDKIGLQRCNYEGQQVFYAAVPTESEVKCHVTSMMEVSLEHISNHFLGYYFVTLSRWITTRPLRVFLFPDLERNEFINQGADFEKLMKETDGIKKEDISYYLEMLKYFREALGIKGDKEFWYRISAAFFNCIMRFGIEGNKDIDGIVYSSANTEKKGSNIALSKNLIDSHTLYCDLVQMWMIKKSSNDPQGISFFPVSNKVSPKADKTFTIEIHPQFIDEFRKAPPLDISAIV
jgi:hypothetical protein